MSENIRLLRPLPRGFVLDNSNHNDFEQGACVIEATAYVSGEPHSDAPECVSPFLTSIAIELNDELPYEDRRLLLPLIPLLVDTRAPAKIERKRGFLLLDVMIRNVIPEILKYTRMSKLTGMQDVRQSLSGLFPIVNRNGAIYARNACKRLDDIHTCGPEQMYQVVNGIADALVTFEKDHRQDLEAACGLVLRCALHLADGVKHHQMIIDGFERVVTTFPGRFVA